jgi:interleukin-1 receptor-associated kinase 1
VGLIDSVKKAPGLPESDIVGLLGECLLIACKTGHPRCTRLLLAAHAAVDHAESDGCTPLYAACLQGHGDCARLLLAAHAIVDRANKCGCTPLYAACDRGRRDCAQLLIDAHAVINHADSQGGTPLIVACHSGQGVCVQLLLDAQAAVDQANNEGFTPLSAACSKGHDDCVKRLLTAHAVVDQANDNGGTPLLVACYKGHGHCVQLLLAAHAVVNQAAFDGRTPLYAACNKGDDGCVKLILAAHAAVDQADGNGATPLIAACIEGHYDCVKLLVQAGARTDVRSASGTALDIAESKGHTFIARSLRNVRLPVTNPASAPVSIEERAAAERAAELAAAALLAEEEAEGAYKQQAQKKKASKSAKAKQVRSSEARAPAEDASAAVRGSAQADDLSKLSLQEGAQLLHAACPETAAGAPVSAPPEAVVARLAAVALTLAELTAATDGFGEQRLIGSGGYGRVFIADALPSLPPEALPPWLRHKPVAVKRAKLGVHNLGDLQREVSVLQQCSHPHLLPLLGYYLEHEAPCLVFPLMRGGSFADRLWPQEADSEHLRRLGLPASLSPLMWHERLRILRQATDALLYLHTPVPGGKGAVVHRDFKPENILLDDELNAYLADTGFAKVDADPEASKMKSASNALYLTRGYLDPGIVQGREYSSATDGWALGITLLVAFTGRSPLSIIDKCEESFELDFPDIDAVKLADAGAGWPPHVAGAIKDVVQSAASGLCHPRDRKRLTVAAALATLSSLDGEDGSGGSGHITAATLGSSQPTSTTAAGYVPTPLSMQVREMRKGSDAHKGIKDNMLLAFSSVMSRLDAIYVARAAKAPEGFEERINYWHRECGMRTDLKDRLHSLRIWRNAASHLDDDRWRRDGPRGEAEASQLVSAVKTAIEALEGAPSR